jgi:hypothetical protein
MSTFQIAYVAMVITGMVLFLAVLGWACIYTRTPKTTARKAPAAQRASQPTTAQA